MSGLLQKLIPLANRVLVRRMLPITQTATGIMLPEMAQKKTNEGEVVSVGPGSRTMDGVLVPMSVEVGDTVLLPEYGGMPVQLNDVSDEYFLFYDSEILAKIVEE